MVRGEHPGAVAMRSTVQRLEARRSPSARSRNADKTSNFATILRHQVIGDHATHNLLIAEQAFKDLIAGSKDHDVFGALAMAINCALVHAEAIDPLLEQTMLEAVSAMGDAQGIYERHGRYGFTGPGPRGSASRPGRLRGDRTRQQRDADAHGADRGGAALSHAGESAMKNDAFAMLSGAATQLGDYGASPQGAAHSNFRQQIVARMNAVRCSRVGMLDSELVAHRCSRQAKPQPECLFAQSPVMGEHTFNYGVVGRLDGHSNSGSQGNTNRNAATSYRGFDVIFFDIATSFDTSAFSSKQKRIPMNGGVAQCVPRRAHVLSPGSLQSGSQGDHAVPFIRKQFAFTTQFYPCGLKLFFALVQRCHLNVPFFMFSAKAFLCSLNCAVFRRECVFHRAAYVAIGVHGQSAAFKHVGSEANVAYRVGAAATVVRDRSRQSETRTSSGGCAAGAEDVLCGYGSEIYRAQLEHWEQFSTTARISGGCGSPPRTEVIWLNPACSAALQRSRGDRFSPPTQAPKATETMQGGRNG